MNTNKFYIIFTSIFGLSGLALLIGGVLMYQNTAAFAKIAEKAPGKVIEVVRRDTTYVPVVEFYTPDHQRFEHISSTGANPPSWKVGDTATVLYDPKDPMQAEIDSFSNMWLGVLILFGLGVINTGIALGVIIWRRRQASTKAWLKSHGEVVQATFARVEENDAVDMNGRCPWKIVSTWRDPDSGQDYEFHSEDIWTREPPVIDQKMIEVYINPKNPKKHFMDISFLGSSRS